MARSEIRDPFAQVARKIRPEMEAAAAQVVAQAAFGGLDGAFDEVVTGEEMDDDGFPVTTVGFTIGLSAIGGPDGIGG